MRATTIEPSFPRGLRRYRQKESSSLPQGAVTGCIDPDPVASNGLSSGDKIENDLQLCTARIQRHIPAARLDSVIFRMNGDCASPLSTRP
jgi:hypothetical protein